MDSFHQHESTGGNCGPDLGFLGTILYLLIIGFALLCPPIGIAVILAIADS